MAFGLYDHHQSWTLGPNLDLAPGDQVRQRWKPQRDAINRLGLTNDQASKVATAVRKATVFDAINTNIVIKYSNAMVVSTDILAVGTLLTYMIYVAKTDDVWRGLLIFTLTGAGMLAGQRVVTKLDEILIGAAAHITRQRPWVEPVPAAVVWAIRIVVGALCAWYATTHVLGVIAGVCRAVVLILLSLVFGTATEILTVWRWRSRYGSLPSSYIATAAMLQPAALLATNRRSWAKQAERKALTDRLRRAAAETALRYSRLARTATRSTGDRARILHQASQVQHALLEHRHTLMEVTSQKEYDALVSEIRKQLVDLADKQWDSLPTAADSRSSRIVAGFVINAALSAAFGIAVNASSEHLPSWMEDANAAYAVLVVMIALTARVLWLERRPSS